MSPGSPGQWSMPLYTYVHTHAYTSKPVSICTHTCTGRRRRKAAAVLVPLDGALLLPASSFSFPCPLAAFMELPLKALPALPGPSSRGGMCAVGTQGGVRATAWPSGLQGGCETGLERIHPQGGLRERPERRSWAPGTRESGPSRLSVERGQQPCERAAARMAGLWQEKFVRAAPSQPCSPQPFLGFTLVRMGSCLNSDSPLCYLSYHTQCQAEMDLGRLCQPLDEAHA